MKTKAKIWVLGLLLICFAGYGTYRYLYQAPRDIATEKADFVIKPEELKESMSAAANEGKYLNKVIQTQGKITSVDQQSVILDHVIQVSFQTNAPSYLNPESELIIKGRCIGYDDLLELVKIDQATVITN